MSAFAVHWNFPPCFEPSCFRRHLSSQQPARGPRKERASSEMTAFDEQISCDYNDLIRFRFLNLTGQLAFKCLKESVAATPGPHDSPKEVKEVS